MSVPTETITVERLARWTKRLSEQHATPLVLLGMGHDHKLGQIVVLTCEEVSDEVLRASLNFALTALSPDAKCAPAGNLEVPNCSFCKLDGVVKEAAFIINRVACCFEHRKNAEALVA